MWIQSEHSVKKYVNLLMQYIKKNYPTAHISGAVSNISFNLPVRKLLNQALRVKEVDYEEVSRQYNAIRKMLDVLGIDIKPLVLNEDDLGIYAKWQEAKSNKDFETADKYRSTLTERGIL